MWVSELIKAAIGQKRRIEDFCSWKQHNEICIKIFDILTISFCTQVPKVEFLTQKMSIFHIYGQEYILMLYPEIKD